MADIAHVFVLMMENRSFDHLLGLAGLDGVTPPPASWNFPAGAADRLPSDPPHEFDDVAAQLGGTPPMSGFGTGAAAALAMRGFGPGTLPVIAQLAQEFVLFDNWYSSMPGPTWPNRFFAHAASSGGLDNSPGSLTSAASETVHSLGFSFENGTLFDSLAAAGKKWRVYHADAFPQVLAIRGLVGTFFNGDTFRTISPKDADDTFAHDLHDNYDVDYTFIEPNYGLLSGNFADGNSQHPVGSMSAGEQFIQYVYETIRNAPVWPRCALLLTWDEHGGFFDHRVPPAAVPPGDANTNGARAAKPCNFAFDRLGVRVPALLISPWAPRGKTGSQLFPRAADAAQDTAFDHASIVRSVRELFGIGKPLTQRDATSPAWTAALLDTCRPSGNDGPRTLGAPLTPALAAAGAAASAATSAAGAASAAGNAAATAAHAGAPQTFAAIAPGATQVNGFAAIAHALDLQMAQDLGSVPAIQDQALFGARLRTQPAPAAHGAPATPAAPEAPAAPGASVHAAAVHAGAAAPAGSAAHGPDTQAVTDYVSYVAKLAQAHKRRPGHR
ncbi:alkaline phosphatase family protein [Paraburkholderia silviterrae]|uniref:Phospholipase n=1 Tax=Paraburkholderia silviterrae TaxID=2528715 RepID=A0A4R5MAG3_9BURK|nr:alkaline phosphatase family protein [Paraburkholderia silviterrae]TDG23361.1 phospholipase [Paraburkholderia silviterrae]